MKEEIENILMKYDIRRDEFNAITKEIFDLHNVFVRAKLEEFRSKVDGDWYEYNKGQDFMDNL